MNCCLWIILLLACRGNCGFNCGNDRSRSGCQEVCYDGNGGCDDNAGNRDNDCGCMNHMHDDCGCMNHMHDDCGCMDRMNSDCGCNNDRRGYETYDRDENCTAYEMYGCQENGIPCPPPVPGNYAR